MHTIAQLLYSSDLATSCRIRESLLRGVAFCNLISWLVGLGTGVGRACSGWACHEIG